MLLLVLGGKSRQDADKLLLIVYMLIKTQLLCCFDMSKSAYNDEIWHNFNVFNYAQLSSRQRNENAEWCGSRVELINIMHVPF